MPYADPIARKRYSIAHKEQEKEHNLRWRSEHVEEIREYKRRYYIEHKEKLLGDYHRYNSEHGEELKEYRIRRLYKMSTKAYDLMLSEQGGTCAICGGTSGKRLCIDHDHSSGAVRGILCITCNTGIGMLNDDAALLGRASKYLKGKGDK